MASFLTEDLGESGSYPISFRLNVNDSPLKEGACGKP